MREWWSLGGTGEKYKLVRNDKVFIYKPAVMRGTSIPNEPRAYVQEAVYHIQNIIDPKSAVFCVAETINSRLGSVQEYVETKNDFDITDWQTYGGPISNEHLRQLMREFVTDWVCCNYDSHCGNFIVDKNGVIRGVDKEQAFKYINKEEAQNVSMTYEPNRMYGEREPIYNVIFRRYCKGKINIDFEDVKKYVKKIANLPDEKFMEIFSPYINSIDPTGSNHMYDKILERKQDAPKKILSFFAQIKMMRKEERPE